VFFGIRHSDARHEPAFPALSLAWKWRVRAAPRTSTSADAREHGAVSDETYPTVPLFCSSRGDASIAACQARGHLHVTTVYGWCPVRQNEETSSIHWRTRANALNARTACIFSEKTKIREIIRRPTEPHWCVPSGDAAIAACQARVRDALESTQFRDNSFC